MEDLRECPCCGKEAQWKAVYNPGRNQGFMRGWVGCPACGLYIQWTHDPAGAIRKWNRRDGETGGTDCHGACAPRNDATGEGRV